PFEPCASAERGLHHCTALAGQFAVSDTTFGGPRPGEALFSFLRARSSLLKIIIALSNMGVVPGARSAHIWPDRAFPWRPTWLYHALSVEVPPYSHAPLVSSGTRKLA